MVNVYHWRATFTIGGERCPRMVHATRLLLRTFLGVLDSCSVAEWPGNLILIYFEYSGLSVHQKLTELHNAVICNNDYYPIVL